MEKAFDWVEHHYHLLIPNCLCVQPGIYWQGTGYA